MKHYHYAAKWHLLSKQINKHITYPGADGFHADVGNSVSDNDLGSGRHQPRGGIPYRRSAATHWYGRHGLLVVARPRGAPELAASRAYL